MNNYFEYKGYNGSAEVNLKDNSLQGHILYIKDVVVYEAKDIAQLKTEFETAVDDYLETCKSLGQDPQTPFKGTIDVGFGESLHREIATQAELNDMSVNDFVKEAVKDRLFKEDFQKQRHSEVIMIILFIGLLLILLNTGVL